MARKRMVTRTAKETVFTVKAINVDTDNIDVVEVAVSSMIPAKKQAQAVQEKLKSMSLAYMKTVSVTERETLYGMPEEDFLRLAVKLPPRTKVDSETGEVETDDLE